MNHFQERIESESFDIDAQKEIVAESERLDIKDKAVIVLCELLFKDPVKILSTIKSNRGFFMRVCFVYFHSKLYQLE